MIVIGVTGGIASGKSAVAEKLAEKGGKLISADKLGHDLLETDSFKEAAWAEWGDSVFKETKKGQTDKNAQIGQKGKVKKGGKAEKDEKGWDSEKSRWADCQIDRGRLAAVVFDPNDSERKNLRRLNALTHPAIGEAVSAQIERFRADGVKRVILDAPLLFETGMETRCDKTVFVDARWSVRRDRVRNRGWTEEEWLRRESTQFSPEMKRERADFVLDNNGPFSETVRQIDHILSETE